MQTTVNDELLREAMQASGFSSQQETVEVGLKLLIEMLSKRDAELLEDLQDVWEAEQVLADIRAGKEKTVSLAEFKQSLGDA